MMAGKTPLCSCQNDHNTLEHTCKPALLYKDLRAKTWPQEKKADDKINEGKPVCL